MADKFTPPGPVFETEDPRERDLWEALLKIRQPDPPEGLRRSFYQWLSAVPAPGERSPWRSLRRWLGNPLLPAAAMLIVGILVGRLLQAPVNGGDLESLTQEVAMLHRDVALSLMRNESASERLRGVIRAADFAAADGNVAKALLRRAASDPSHTVRVAAIDALASRVQAAEVGQEVLRLLAEAVSPLVQRALADLILRHGSAAQLEVLLEFAHQQALHPEIAAYVQKTVRRTRA